MSLEAKIEALTSAVETLTAQIGAMIKAGGGTAAAGGTKTTGKPTTKSGPTKADVAKRFGAYLDIEDKAKRKVRIANMGKINAKFEVEKITDGTPEQWVEALEMLDKLEAGEDPFEDDADDGGALV